MMPAEDVADLLCRIPGEPLALDGRMELMTTMNANQALAGVRDCRGVRRNCDSTL